MSLVIAICGTMGSGKSTLVKGLTGQLASAESIAEDDFNPAFGRSVEEVGAWWQRGGDVNEFDFSGLAATIAATSERFEIVLLETHFGRQHAALRPLIDLQLWLDVPFDIAFARKIGQFSRDPDFRHQSSADALTWMAAFSDSYLDVTRPMFCWQRTVIGGQSDERVSGEGDVKEVLSRVFVQLSAALNTAA